MRIGRAAGTLSLLVLLPIAGFVVGSSVERASTGAEGPDSVWVAVSTETVEDLLSFSAEAVTPPVQSVVARGQGTITDVLVMAGERVTVGDRLYDLDGLPVFASRADEFLPYRDLGVGDEGADVTDLQEFLRTLGRLDREPTGTFDDQTAIAVSELMSATSGRPQETFPSSSVVLVDPNVLVRSIAVEPGMVVSLGDEVMTQDGGPPVVEAETSTATAAELGVGATVELVGRGTDVALAGTIASVSGPEVTDDGRTVHRVIVELGDEHEMRGGSQFRVSLVRASSSAGEVSVPVVAVRTDAAGVPYVVLRRDRDGTPQRTPVRLGVSDGTMVAIESVDVTADDEVEVRTGPGD